MSDHAKTLVLNRAKMRPLAGMTTRETLQIQHHLGQMRLKLIKAQTDVAHALMLEEGESQTALEAEVMGFMREAQAHFASLKDLLIEC